MFDHHFQIAIQYFDQGLPYWCDEFNRPADEDFADYIRKNGHKVTYIVLEKFDPVYIPEGCDLNRVQRTALKRVNERENGLSEAQLTVLL